jgi:hypothetical protein
MSGRDRVVCMETGYELEDRGSESEYWYGEEFSLLHVIQTGSGAHPASYPMSSQGAFPGDKAAGA